MTKGRRDTSRPTAVALLCLAPALAWAETDFFAELAVLPPVQAAIGLAAETAARDVVAEATGDAASNPLVRRDVDRLTSLIRRETEAALTDAARSRFAIAMDEEQAAALVDLAVTPEGAALVEALMLATIALRQTGGDLAAAELERADRLVQGIVRDP